MKIFIYGDSNTYGQIPNIEGYSKNAAIRQYPIDKIWWYPLTKKHEVIVNGVPGRAISNDNPWLEGRNASLTIDEDINGVNPDMVIIQLGTNDCKSRYGLSAEDITKQMDIFASYIQEKTGASIMIISPATIMEGNKITDKFYKGGQEKSRQLDNLFKKLSANKGFEFVSGKDLSVGEDGEHLTLLSHHILSQRIMQTLEKINANLHEKY